MIDPNQSVPVPQKQKVDDVLLFGLTMRHTAYILGPTVGVLVAFQSLGLPPSQKFVVLGATLAVSTFLAFLHVQGVPFYHWCFTLAQMTARPRRYRSQRQGKKQAASSDFLRIEGIESSGIVVSRASPNASLASYTRIVRVTPPNYRMMRGEERARALGIMQAVLTGADRPLQVMTHSLPYDPEPYFRSFRAVLDRIKSPTFRRHTLLYLDWMESHTKRNQVVDREYFVIFRETAPFQAAGKPLSPGEQAAKQKAIRNLAVRTESLRGQFSGMGALAEPLTRHEAWRLLQQHFNPPTHTRHSKLRRVMEDVPTAQAPPGVLEVPDMDVHAKHLRVGNDFVRTLCIKAYPNRLPATWLAGILTLGHRITVSLHFEPKDPAMVRKRLLRSRSALDSRLQARLKGGWRGQAVEDQRLLEALDEQIGDLVKGTTQFFEASIYIGIHGTSLRQVDEVAGEVLYKLRGMSIVPFTAPFVQKQAFTACLPLGLNPDGYHSQTMDAACAAAAYPFLTSSLKHANGNLLGNHADTGSHYIVDRWEAQNYNRIVAGTSGGGKSFTVKLDMERTKMLRPWAQIYVIDPLREFDAITRNLGGQIVYVGDKGTVLNPFELQKNLLEDMGHGVDKITTNAYNRKLAFLEAFFRILLEDRLSPIEHSHLMLTLQELYQRFGITEARDSHDRKPPIFSDLLALCDEQAATHPDEQRRAAVRNIATHLRACLLGPLGYLNGHSNVDLYADVVTFDLQSLESEHFKVFMFLVLDFINQRMYKDPTRHKVLYLDEAWILLHHPATAAVLAEMNRHTRHVMMGVDYITQTPQDFFRNSHGETIRLTCAQSLLFRQETVSDETRQSYGLDAAEADMLMRFTAAKGAGYREVLYINGTQKAHLAIFAAPEEYELGTTNPQDIAERHKIRNRHIAAEVAA